MDVLSCWSTLRRAFRIVYYAHACVCVCEPIVWSKLFLGSMEIYVIIGETAYEHPPIDPPPSRNRSKDYRLLSTLSGTQIFK